MRNDAGVLEHHRVANRDRRCNHAGGFIDREVPWLHREQDADRVEFDPAITSIIGERS